MKKHILYVIVVTLGLLLVISGCGTTQQIKNIREPEVSQIKSKVKQSIVEQEVKEGTDKKFVLHLISTTHNEGNLFPYDVIQNVELDYSLMNVAHYVGNLRDNGEHVVVLSSGDNLIFDPLVYYFNTINTTSPHIVPRVYNDVGYDVVAIGQQDIIVGQDVYQRVLNESKYPYVGANIVDEITHNPVVKPYVVIKKGGVSIAVVGLTDPLGTPWFIDEQVIFDDMIASSSKWISIIREKENVDIIIALVSSNRENFSEIASSIASTSMDGFDVIIGGNSPTNLTVKDLSGKDVHIIGSMSKAQSINHLEATFDFDEGKSSYTLSSITSKDVSMNNVELDETLLSSYKDSIKEVTSWANSKVGKISESVSSREALFKDSAFVDSIHSVQRTLTSAEISISAPLSIDTTIEKGNITVRDLFRLYPAYHHIYTMNLSGQELRDMISYSYGKWFNPMSSLDNDILKFKKDDNGEFIYNEKTRSIETNSPVSIADSYSGINYVVNIAKPKEIQVSIKTMEDGRTFSPKTNYRVALNSFRGQGGGGHLEAAGITKEIAKERLVSVSEKDVIYYLLAEAQKFSIVEPIVDNNWLMIPALWATRGMENSYTKLFTEIEK